MNHLWQTGSSIIQPFLDPGQCGMKGFSITHYLIKLLHFAHVVIDRNQPHLVLAACVDFSKAFNRVSHNLLVQDLYDMHTPPWLLNILVSYSQTGPWLCPTWARCQPETPSWWGPSGSTSWRNYLHCKVQWRLPSPSYFSTYQRTYLQIILSESEVCG